MSLIAWAPSLVCALVARWKGAERALVFVALPTLVLLPAYYTHKLPGLPIASFHNYTLLVTAAALFLAGARTRVVVADVLVAGLCATAVLSEFVTRDGHEAKNLAALMLMGTVAPYWIGRVAARETGRLVALVGMVALAGAFVGWVSPWEARMGSNPFDFWRRLWPHWVPWDGALYRGGLRRVAGPFAHPICSGFFFSMALPLALWLTGSGLPRRRWERLVLMAGLFLGLGTALSRGPILGAVLALSIAHVGALRCRRWIVVGGVALAFFSIPFMLPVIEQYFAVDRSSATTEAQETAAYRKEMLERYLEVVAAEPLLGYGRYQIPVVAGLKSIDNQYLFLALSHGLPHALLFLSLLLWSGLSLAASLLRIHVADPVGRLGWALVGLLGGAVLTQATVFAGTQTAPLLLLFVGLAVGVRERLGSGPETGHWAAARTETAGLDGRTPVRSAGSVGSMGVWT